MNERRLRTGGPRDERIPQHIIEAHDWIGNHRNELIQQFGECYMIVFQQQVLGTGKTYDDALDNAERNLPSEINDLPAMVEWVGGHRYPFGLLRVKRLDEGQRVPRLQRR